jgi:signal transduction histidine kinase
MPVRTRLGVVWNLVAKSLSGRLLLLTLLFVLAGQVLIFVPGIGLYHRELLGDHILSAELAILPFTEPDGRNLPQSLREEVLKHADADAVLLKQKTRSDFFQVGAMHAQVDRTIDLTKATLFSEMADGLDCLFGPGTRTIYVIAPTEIRNAQWIGIVLSEASVRAALVVYARRIVAAGLFLSGLAAALVFVSLYFFLVRPMRHITRSMVSFRENPQDAGRIFPATSRADEIGLAERELAAMQRELGFSLKQKERLAALGSAVARIQHDLRNILATAQLASDRLAASDDPAVRRLTPSLVAALDRAVALATSTLDFGKTAAPKLVRFALRPLLAEAAEAALGSAPGVVFDNRVVADLSLEADRDQIFRVVLNLLRNAAEAMEGRGKLTVTAAREERAVTVEIADDGPGISEAVRARMFEPFVSASRAGGFGLGLAIARELVRGHGGELMLVASGAEGTVFRFTVPDRS